MKKIYLIIISMLFMISCFDGDPLDPAKGIDSQGETTVLTGTLPGGTQTIYCYKLDYSGTKITPERWKITTSDGDYYKRDNLADASHGIQLTCGAVDIKIIPASGIVDYNSSRQSPYDPVYIRNF